MWICNPCGRMLFSTQHAWSCRMWFASYMTSGKCAPKTILHGQGVAFLQGVLAKGAVCYGFHQDKRRWTLTNKECLHPNIYIASPKRQLGRSLIYGQQRSQTVISGISRRPLRFLAQNGPWGLKPYSEGWTMSGGDNTCICIHRSHLHYGGWMLSRDDNTQMPRSRPPWNVMFFGTDHFALEPLKILHRYSKTEETLIGRLEVVSLPTKLPKGFPVTNYAIDQGLPMHKWPDTGQCNEFDVGVVASFGRLLSEDLISQFPYGILNIHPSLLPRWRGSAPIMHTMLNGDEETGVTIMQIRPKRFDVGPIVMQQTFPVPPKCSYKDLEAMLSNHGAEMLVSVLKNLPDCLSVVKEQPKEGVTFAPKVSAAISCIRWVEQTPEEIIRLERAVGFMMPLQAVWKGTPIKLLNVEEVPDSLISSDFSITPGAIKYLPVPNILVVRCKDGWIGIRTVKLKKNLSAKDFYNGYLHSFTQKSDLPMEECCFTTLKLPEKPKMAK